MKSKKTIIILAAALFANISPAVGLAAENTTATITINAQKDGAFLFVPQEITVSSDTAEEYGFTDSDSGVTFIDALTTVHKLIYGDDFTPETAASYLDVSYKPNYDYNYIIKAFGESAAASGYFINNKVSLDTYEKALLTDGDIVEYAFYTDTDYYMDCYTAFIPNKVTVCVNEPARLNMYMTETPMWYAPKEPEPIYDEYDFEAMTINLINPDGSLGAALTDDNNNAIVPDEDGIVTLTFDAPGTYMVTASGFIGEDYPIIAPFCIVTVKPQYSLENISITARATVKKAENAEDAKIILAVYKDGVLTGTETKTAVNGEISFDTDIANGSTVKMFIWDDVNGMKPFTSVN